MFRKASAAAVLPTLLILGCSDGERTLAGPTAATPPSADAVLAEVVAAMGTGSLDSITYTGRAWRPRNGWMQTPSASPPWPWRDEITEYRRTIDLNAPASLARGQTFASDIFLNPPTEGAYTQNIMPTQDNWAQQLEIWLTPWGFLEGAEANGVELGTGLQDGVEYRVLSWMSPEAQTSPSGMRYTVNGYIDDADRVAAVETWVEDNFMGDFHIVQVFDNYREVDGVMVPQSIEQQRGGGGVFGVIVADADANPPNLAELMSTDQGGGGAGRGGRRGGGPGPGGGPPAAPAPADLVEDLGDGAWLITGGYTALAVEFEDHLMVFEAGQPESRGDDIIAAVEAVLPAKPIRYVVNSHPHSDHTGGLVPFMRHGATLITHENNVEFLNMALNTPRTLLGEPNLNAEVEGVSGVTVYEDSMNRLELHSVPQLHTDGMLVAVLPQQGVMFQADFTLPQAGAEANPFVRELAQYVADNDVQFERYLAVHAAQEPQSRDDLLGAIGQ
jgi:glyoxylase-like metal-dependent hydrolase (beta-lactamase superfamily II)